ncbi:MAG: N-6 DNA methylase [Anaerolineales bacterium]|nr:N-6 DNA methylase [Anaerolineales bacterium]
MAELRRLRLAQQGVAQDTRHPLELQGEFERLAHELNSTLNQGLSIYFGQEVAAKRPFNWIVEFPEIFLDETGQLKTDGGFTFVIGNPPYLSVDDTWGQNSPDAAYLKAAFAEIWAGKSDIYYYFIRRALALLATHGQLGFITARYYLEAYYASKLRQVMLAEAVIRQVVDFGDYTVFLRVGTKTCITLLQQEVDAELRKENHFLFDRSAHKNIDILAFLGMFRETAHPFSQANLDADSWNLYGHTVAQIIQKIDDGAIPLGDLTFIGQGMQTGRNPVFVVDKATLDRYQIEPELIRKIIKNQDITPYNLGFRGCISSIPKQLKRWIITPTPKLIWKNIGQG